MPQEAGGSQLPPPPGEPRPPVEAGPAPESTSPQPTGGGQLGVSEIQHPRGAHIREDWLNLPARNLREAQEKLEYANKFNQGLRWWDKLLGATPFDINKLRSSKESSERQYQRKVEEAEREVEQLNRVAREAVGYWPGYAEEQQRLAQETGAEPIILEPMDFIETYEDVSVLQEFREEKSKILAAVDFFKPRSKSPVEIAGLESRQDQRFPRMEIGSKDPAQALEAAHVKGFNYVLKIKQDLKVTSDELKRYGINRRYPVVRIDEVYVPISQETATLLNHAGNLGDSASLYVKGAYKDWPTMNGVLDYEFQAMPLEQAAEEKRGESVTLTYDKVDLRTQVRVPVSIQVRGEDIKDARQKAVAHLLGLEMNEAEPYYVAQRTKVQFGDQELAWEQFDQMFGEQEQVQTESLVPPEPT